MKHWISAFLSVALLGTAAGGHAQSGYPSKSIRMVVPYSAGGGLDAITRLVAQGMSENLGQSIVVDNKPGGGGTIGADIVAKSAADGYTVLMAGNPELVINPTLMPATRYNVMRDLTPIMLVAESPNVIVAHPGFKPSLKEMLAGQGRSEGPLAVGTPGQGSPQHLSMEVINSLGKADLVHIPYKGAAPAVTDVLGGQVKLVISGSPPLIPYIKSGKLKALAVTQAKRSALLPDIPSLEEATGLRNLDSFSTWYGLLVPAATPAPVVEALHKSIAAVLAKPEVKAKINTMGAEVIALPSAAFGDRIRSEQKQYENIIQRFNIKAD